MGESLVVRVEPEAVVYERLPYWPSVHYPAARLGPTDLVEVDPIAFPPRVLTTRGEFLPVPRPLFGELAAFGRRAGVPLVARTCPWDTLLNPFLDTEFTPEDEAQAQAALGAMGFDVAEIARIRARVERRMLWLTYWTWEWVNYGLFDVLDAMATPLLRRPSYRRFYADAQAIARRGTVSRRLTGLYTVEDGITNWEPATKSDNVSIDQD